MIDPTVITIMIYPVKGRAYTREKQSLLTSIAKDVNSIIEEEVDHA